MKKITAITIVALCIAFNLSNLCFSQQQHELWGMTSAAGSNGAGIIFKTDCSGNNETV